MTTSTSTSASFVIFPPMRVTLQVIAVAQYTKFLINLVVHTTSYGKLICFLFLPLLTSNVLLLVKHAYCN